MRRGSVEVAPAGLFVPVLAVLAALACGPVVPGEPEWPPMGKKWFDRAAGGYRSGDIEDAQLAVVQALAVVPEREEVRLLAARIALSQLEYDEALKHLERVQGSDASAIRGRALWYSGRMDQAADELEKLIADPDVRDDWAKDIARLARRGAGRTPFRVTGGLLAVSEMPRVAATTLVVPLEVNGEPGLAMLATGTAESVIDSQSTEPTWVSLRFGERVEVKDVPALSKDLSGLSRQLNAPIKMLLGVNLLRHLRPTFDFMGGQFVVRTFDPPPPPEATTIRLNYIRGGGMLLRGVLGAGESAPKVSLLIDTSWTFPVALDGGGWKKAGIRLDSLEPVPTMTDLKHGLLPVFRIGAFELPQVTSVYGAPIDEIEKGLDVDLDGLAGSGLFAPFRVTITDGGRTMWLEDLPAAAYRDLARSRGSPGGPLPSADDAAPEGHGADEPPEAPSTDAPEASEAPLPDPP